MKKLFLLSVFICIHWNCGTSVNLQESAEIITPSLLEEYISFLASDELRGRNTPGAELDSAGVYIARQFESFGLKKVNDSWLHKIPLGYTSLGEKNHLIVIKDGKENPLEIKNDFVPFEITGNSSVSGQLVFCGYGIEAPEYNYNDFQNINLTGKIVLLLKHEPGENDSLSVFDGTRNSEYSGIEAKTLKAFQKGAAGVIIVNDPLNHTSLRPIGFPWPSLSKMIPEDALPLSILKNEFNNVPVVQAGEEFINIVFGSVDKLREIQKRIDTELTGYSEEFPNIKINISTTISVKETPAYNVIGLLEGSDPSLKNEILVIGAHYDHVGIKKVQEDGVDNIFNGADDNASGTSGMMAIAKAFSHLDKKPLRSVLFIAFAGEEKGLFGSRYYVDYPLFPLENTVAMLNLDMIGRNGIDSVYINAHSRSPQLKAINEEENKNLNMTLIHRGETSVGGSDHAPFIRKGIAALFYHSGTHKDYHQVTDEASLIDFNKAAKISQLAFRTAFRISNDSTKYKVIEKSTSLIY
jgi:hypothetical protein